MRHVTQIRTSQKPAGKPTAGKAVSLSIVGGTVSKTIAVHMPRKPRAKAAPLSHEDCCVLCDTAIERFDRETFLATGRCGPCDDALERDA